jgi:hypothetical protein
VLIFLAGIAHMVLSIASTFIPKALEWHKSLNTLPVLLKQMFWAYAGYILIINFSFGLLSVLGTKELLDRSFLAQYITLFITIYWFARLLIQFFYFDTTQAPKGFWYKSGEIALILLFALFTGIYFTAFLYNGTWI